MSRYTLQELYQKAKTGGRFFRKDIEHLNEDVKELMFYAVCSSGDYICLYNFDYTGEQLRTGILHAIQNVMIKNLELLLPSVDKSELESVLKEGIVLIMRDISYKNKSPDNLKKLLMVDGIVGDILYSHGLHKSCPNIWLLKNTYPYSCDYLNIDIRKVINSEEFDDYELTVIARESHDMKVTEILLEYIDLDKLDDLGKYNMGYAMGKYKKQKYYNR